MLSSEVVNNSRFTVLRLEFALQSQILRHIQTHSHQLFQTSTHTFDTLANHLPGQPGQAGTRMSPFSPFWILLELRQMKVMATTGAIRDASQIVTTNKPAPNSHFCKQYLPLIFILIQQPIVTINLLHDDFTKHIFIQTLAVKVKVKFTILH